MLKKSVIWRVLLLVVVIATVNFYFGCVHKHYAPGGQYQTKDGAQLQEQDKQIKELQKELEALKEKP